MPASCGNPPFTGLPRLPSKPLRREDLADPDSPAAVATRRAFWGLMARTKFNRDLLAISEAVDPLCDMLQAFVTEHDLATMTGELLRTGLVTRHFLNAPVLKSFLEPADFLSEDAAGFLWTAKTFLSIVQTHTIELNPAERVPLPTAEEAAIPFEVTGGAA